MEPTQVRLTIPDSVDPTALMGPADSLLRRIEDGFDAMVSVRGNVVSVSGPADVVDQVTSVFSRLIRLVEAGETPAPSDVELVVDQVRHGAERLAAFVIPCAPPADVIYIHPRLSHMVSLPTPQLR